MVVDDNGSKFLNISVDHAKHRLREILSKQAWFSILSSLSLLSNHYPMAGPFVPSQRLEQSISDMNIV